MLSYLLNWLGIATTSELDALYHRAEAAERGLARVQARLGELEALHTAAPEQVGVATLLAREQLGKHAEVELLRMELKRLGVDDMSPVMPEVTCDGN